MCGCSRFKLWWWSKKSMNLWQNDRLQMCGWNWTGNLHQFSVVPEDWMQVGQKFQWWSDWSFAFRPFPTDVVKSPSLKHHNSCHKKTLVREQGGLLLPVDPQTLATDWICSSCQVSRLSCYVFSICLLQILIQMQKVELGYQHHQINILYFYFSIVLLKIFTPLFKSINHTMSLSCLFN